MSDEYDPAPDTPDELEIADQEFRVDVKAVGKDKYTEVVARVWKESQARQAKSESSNGDRQGPT
jgi:hypothetical protein